MVRGGGDCGEQWAEDARRDKKYKSIEDIESVIRYAQDTLHLSAEQTCLYGRSAGGYIVGAVCAHHRMGDLIGAAYAEVPYVDILRTTTNPKLPLTILEYDEFGNPAEKLEDLRTILRLSPVDALPPEGAPGIFVIATTSTNDREVLPYESVKWILKLRGFPEKVSGQLKLLRILDGQGHFVKGEDAFQQKAEDFLLLQTYLQSKKNKTLE
jgi:oligopeptidase B